MSVTTYKHGCRRPSVKGSGLMHLPQPMDSITSYVKAAANKPCYLGLSTPALRVGAACAATPRAVSVSAPVTITPSSSPQHSPVGDASIDWHNQWYPVAFLG